ncbi:ABC transporter permease [Rhodospirillum rubrum]|uniref:Inner-membrane translocator n=1 Tax=Rhodospirillum rubrum (strain ATCC 11170 / ATH 1.1.1 / DSM 467 / LMG 4362 / NCIMB 8255 / S1) TaxID=269796 RepID=Q2RQL1_RHORT|nr:ABC transporter permease [Rhodospirillum rubrum]ABC23584.1 inner-membrane translocator [Rhodospirillum rubrum ATCC 11170]AEO49322.1 inner-membrane translocator [Rhodospirillum rubrum F11]MBK5955259.1 ABC transporter permease [Rhodospirillum rubrum]QXG79546.1 ABC transporter permease [Rhodospirillum rubrum]HAP98801.1 ABC transporter permease [Rhodospirillum rubrum]
MDLLDLLLSAGLWATVLRIATPLIFGTLGELLCERAGVLNLGIEGIMTLGALVGWLSVYQGCDLWTGVMLAACAGMAAGLLQGLLTVPLGLSQHVTGIGVTLLCTSLSYYVYRLALPQTTTPPSIAPFAPFGDGALADLPVIGGVLAQQTPLTMVALCAVVAIAWLLYRTPLGLAIRMVGENPAAADAQGISVTAVRMGAVMAGSALMAVGGAFLTLSAFNAFFFNMIGGRGWICIALVVFASWRPGKALFGALLFALFDALQTRLQQGGDSGIPYQVYLMAPYVLSIVALVVMSRRAAYPQALMIPFRKGER